MKTRSAQQSYTEHLWWLHVFHACTELLFLATNLF